MTQVKHMKDSELQFDELSRGNTEYWKNRTLESDDLMFLKRVEYYRRNMKRPSFPPVTYDDAMADWMLPELIKRFEKLIQKESEK